MALKRELAQLLTSLLSKAELLPPKVKSRTVSEIQEMFTNYEKIDNDQILDILKTRALSKLTILEMSVPDPQPVPVSDLGVKKYVFKDGKLVEGEGMKKLEVDYSNWYAGNVDPADLRRHKELMDRMCYRGPFWENRKRNPSILEEEAKYDYVPPETPPPEDLRKKKEQESFEYVKR